MRRIHLQSISERKLASAKLLYANKHFSDAYYLSGYAIEFALKACIAKGISADTIPDKDLISKIYVHDFNQLIGLSGLRSELNEAVKENSNLGANWGICQEWHPDFRYKDVEPMDANSLIVAIGDRESGVLQWIKNYW